MLRRLRRQFTLFSTSLVGIVLLAVMASSLVATWRNNESLLRESLERSANDRISMMSHLEPIESDDQLMGGPPHTRQQNMTQLIAIASDQTVAASYGAGLLDTDTEAQDLIDAVFAEASEDGTFGRTTLGSQSLAWYLVSADSIDRIFTWMGTSNSDVAWLMTVESCESLDAEFRQLVFRETQIVLIALAALFAISWWLSGWALSPVEKSWDQQQRFVADASHELKTPLAVIVANTQILERDESLSDDARKWVHSTAEEAASMKSLVNDLLTLARADESAAGSASGAMRQVDVDLSDLVESATLEFDAVAFERGCTLDAHVQQSIHVQGDPEWLMRVVTILVDNACKYGAVGSSVRVDLAQQGSKVRLLVNNQGSPIDAADLPHVFDRFYRSDKARSRDTDGAGGFGLGLAIAKGVVEAHGGRISVSSSEENGTTFEVVLRG